jgi:hypothetical protein
MGLADDGDDLCRIDETFIERLAQTGNITRILQAESLNVCTHRVRGDLFRFRETPNPLRLSLYQARSMSQA